MPSVCAIELFPISKYPGVLLPIRIVLDASTSWNWFVTVPYFKFESPSILLEVVKTAISLSDPFVEVTVPVFDVLLLNVDQSVEDKAPVVLASAVAIEMSGVVPPEEAIGAVPATLVTPEEELVPAPIALLKSAADKILSDSSLFNWINLSPVISGIFNKFFPIVVVALVPKVNSPPVTVKSPVIETSVPLSVIVLSASEDVAVHLAILLEEPKPPKVEVLSIFCQASVPAPSDTYTAQSPTTQSVIPSKFVLPATETI